jgi:chromosomal replication initiator protein
LQTRERDERDVSAALGPAIARRIGEARYKLWFERHTRFQPEGDRLIVGVPNRHYQEWLKKTFADAIADAAGEVCGQALTVRFVIDPELFREARREQAQAATPPIEPEPAAAVPATALVAPPPAPLPRPKQKSARPGSHQPGLFADAECTRRPSRRFRSLVDFVVGPCNRVAHAAAVSVVEAAGEGANPLVLHGSVGTGKTHLLEGIYLGLRRSHASWRICYCSAEEFTNRFVQAMRFGKLTSFRKHFRNNDVLLLDDLNFLARKKATQEEFLHTFDELLADGRQIVLTCDCHPRLADDFTPELTDRLLGGVVWGLTPPDADTRLDVLRAKAARLPAAAPPEEVLAFLATQLRGNIRELEGALNSVRHFAQATGRPLDLPLAKEALGDLIRHSLRVVQLDDVDRAVRAALRLDRGALQSRGREWALSHPRMVAIYLARKHTAAAYSAIGAHFGGRNYSTAVAAEKKVRQWLEANDEVCLGERRLRVRELVERAERELLK